MSERELLAQPLAAEHYGVIRTYTFEMPEEGWSVTERALVVLSRTLRRRQRRRRAQCLREQQATLRLIAGERLNRRKYKRRAYVWERVQKGVCKCGSGVRWPFQSEDQC